MGLFRYSSDELRDRLARAVALRWPDERLLVSVPCLAERPPEENGSVSPPVALDLRGPSPDGRAEWQPALLGVTQGRLLYQREARSGVALRIGWWMLGAIGLAALTSGEVRGFFLGVVLAAALWVAERIVEALSLDGTDLAFSQIEDVDVSRQEIRGVGRSGTRHRLRIRDPDQFGTIVQLVFRPPATSMGA